MLVRTVSSGAGDAGVDGGMQSQLLAVATKRIGDNASAVGSASAQVAGADSEVVPLVAMRSSRVIRAVLHHIQRNSSVSPFEVIELGRVIVEQPPPYHDVLLPSLFTVPGMPHLQYLCQERGRWSRCVTSLQPTGCVCVEQILPILRLSQASGNHGRAC